MKIARPPRERKHLYFSLDELQRLLAKLKIKEKGMTKSGEKILFFKGQKFTITRGNAEGFEIDKVAGKIAHKLTKIKQKYVPGTLPLDSAKEEAFALACEKLKKKIKQIGFG